MLCGALLDAEVLEHRRRSRRRRCGARRRGSAASSTPQRARVVGDRRPARERVEHAPRRRSTCSREELVVDAGPPGRARRPARPGTRRRVPGRTRRWKSASSAVSVRDAGRCTIIDRSGSLAISLQHHARAREALRLPRVLADEHRDLGVLEVAARVAAVELVLDPDLAGLLLGQRARAVARAERPQEGAAVGAAEVVPLAAAAVVEDRLAAVLVARSARSRAATSAIAVSQSISSKRAVRRGGAAARSGGARPFW